MKKLKNRFKKQFMPYSIDELEQYEEVYGESKTIPNQVMSPKEMLERFTRGQTIDTAPRQPFYSEIELPDPRTMDLVDLHEHIDRNKVIINEFNEEQVRRQKAKDLEDLKKQVREDMEKALKEDITSTPPPPPKIE